MTSAEIESGFPDLYFEGNNFQNELDGEYASENHVQVVQCIRVNSALTLVLQTTDYHTEDNIIVHIIHISSRHVAIYTDKPPASQNVKLL